MQELIDEISHLFGDMGPNIELIALGTKLIELDQKETINENYNFLLDFLDVCVNNHDQKVIKKAIDFTTSTIHILIKINFTRAVGFLETLFCSNENLFNLIHSETVIGKILGQNLENKFLENPTQSPLKNFKTFLSEYNINKTKRSEVKKKTTEALLEKKESIALSLIFEIEDIDITHVKQYSSDKNLTCISCFCDGYIKDTNDFLELAKKILDDSSRFKNTNFWQGSMFRTNFNFIIQILSKYYSSPKDIDVWFMLFSTIRNNHEAIDEFVSFIIKNFKCVDIYQKLVDETNKEVSEEEKVKNLQVKKIMESKMFEHMFEQIENQKSLEELTSNHNKLIIKTFKDKLEEGTTINPLDLLRQHPSEELMCKKCGKHYFNHNNIRFSRDLEEINIVKCDS